MPAPHLSTLPVAEVELLTEWIVAHVQTVLPAAGGEVARAAVGAAATGARGMAALRDHLERHPDTLTFGHPDVAPVMCKFIRALADAGTGAVLPVCVHHRSVWAAASQAGVTSTSTPPLPGPATPK